VSEDYTRPNAKGKKKNIKTIDREKWQLAENICLKRELEIKTSEHGLIPKFKQDADPFAIGILLIEINEKTCEVKKIKPDSVLDSNFVEVSETKVSVGAFQNYAATPLFWRGQGEVIINA
jgi:hypothetical protein